MPDIPRDEKGEATFLITMSELKRLIREAKREAREAKREAWEAKREAWEEGYFEGHDDGGTGHELDTRGNPDEVDNDD